MFINPFVCGVLATLLVEFAAMLVYSIFRHRSK